MIEFLEIVGAPAAAIGILLLVTCVAVFGLLLNSLYEDWKIERRR